MSSIVDDVERARRSGNWSALAQAIPYLRFLGADFAERDGTLVGRLPASPALVGNPTLPALHGGVLGGLLEAAAQLELLFRAQTVVQPKTITLTIEYLRSGKLQETWVKAAIVRTGRRVATVTASAWQDDERQAIATATAHFLIIGS